jgi:2-dehydro-3-deoxygluconokinase
MARLAAGLDNGNNSMDQNLKIASVGEAMIELALGDTTAQVGVAGDTLNMAVYLKRAAGSAMDVSFVSVVGRDRLSDRIVNFIADQGICTDHISRHPTRQPGLYTIETDPSGERSFAFWREASAARTLFADGFETLAQFDVIYFSAITLAILPDDIRLGLLQWLENCTGTVVFDSNYRPKLWESVSLARRRIEQAWRVCDIALPSLDDEMALFGDASEAAALDRLRGYGITQGALKRGAIGPRPIATEASAQIYPAAPKVVDTTAAGDSFAGAFLASYLAGGSLDAAMMAGHLLALKVIAKKGAITAR